MQGLGRPYKVKQGVKLDNCEGSKFLLELMVGSQCPPFSNEVSRVEALLYPSFILSHYSPTSRICACVGACFCE